MTRNSLLLSNCIDLVSKERASKAVMTDLLGTGKGKEVANLPLAPALQHRL